MDSDRIQKSKVKLRASIRQMKAYKLFTRNRLLNATVAFCYVTIKPNSQKNDVRCEYTREVPETL